MGELIIPFGVGTMWLAIMITFGDARSIESHHIQKKFQANAEPGEIIVKSIPY